MTQTGWTEEKRRAASERAKAGQTAGVLKPPPVRRSRFEPAWAAAVWLPRAKQLAERVVGFMTPAQVVSLRYDLGWSEDLVRNVMAYAEGRTLQHRGGKWSRV